MKKRNWESKDSSPLSSSGLWLCSFPSGCSCGARVVLVVASRTLVVSMCLMRWVAERNAIDVTISLICPAVEPFLRRLRAFWYTPVVCFSCV